MGLSASKHKKSSKKSMTEAEKKTEVKVNEDVEVKVGEENLIVNGNVIVDHEINHSVNNCPEVEIHKPQSYENTADAKALKKANNKGGNRKITKGNKCKQRQQTKHHHGSNQSIPPPSPEPQMKADTEDRASRHSVAAESITSSDRSQELENALTEQMRTLEREKHDLTADLSTLNVGPIASEDDNLSADDIDASSVDDLDTVVHQDKVTFDSPVSPSKLSHLNKNRAPKQKKRPPARYSMLLGQEEAEVAFSPGASSKDESKQPDSQAQEKIKKKRGSKEKKQKKRGKYNKKNDAKLDDSVVEV